jgi:signal transduction histidine kinase
MNLLRRGRAVTWVVSFALACVLVLLATLQYRWSREVGEAASARMLSSLRGAMVKFREDLSRQLGTMCMALEPEAGKSTPDPKKLAQTVENWEAANSLPNLVSDLYVVKSAHGDRLFLFHLQPRGRLTPVEWPAQFATIRQAILAQSQKSEIDNSDKAPQPSVNPRATARAMQIGGIDESLSMLVVPTGPNHHSSWLLVGINPQVLAQHVYPDLAQDYFGESPDYELAVVARSDNQSKVFYSSDEGFGNERPAETDASLNLFGPPWTVRHDEVAMAEYFPGGPVGKENAVREFSGEGGGAFGPIRFDPVHSTADDPQWQIIARHRKGSVEAAVAEIRRWNLEISFGVLLVLAASMALILLTSQRAHRLATLQMDFVAGVSHELRTPVASILSISDNLVDGIVDDPQQFERYGRLIRSQARQLNHLVEQVLRFSATRRATTGYMVRPVHLAEVVDEALENTSNLLTASGYRVEQKTESGLGTVEADFGALSQCLQNLITNAIKYGGDDRWIGIDVRHKDGEALLTVKDRGIGIEDQDLKHIFEPFYRSPKVTETQIHGTGLGLALAKSFAEAMGGRLTVESVLGKGSAFTIHLPYGKRPTEVARLGGANVPNKAT